MAKGGLLFLSTNGSFQAFRVGRGAGHFGVVSWFFLLVGYRVFPDGRLFRRLVRYVKGSGRGVIRDRLEIYVLRG